MHFFNKIKILQNILLNKPILAVWYLTDKCNFDCLYCMVHERKTEDLSFDEIKETFYVIKDLGIRYIFLQGGEPLLRKDIIQILSLCLEYKIKPTIVTNGTYINHELINYIKDRDINLTISLPTLNHKKHLELTKNDNLKEILKNIEQIKNVKHIGNWSITTTITRTNYNEINHIKDFAEKNNFMYAIRSYIHDIGAFGKSDSKLKYGERREDIIRAFRELSKIEEKRNYLAHLIYEEEIKYLKEGYSTPCDAIKHSIIVNSDGSFSPCIEHVNQKIKGNKKIVNNFLATCKDRVQNCYQNTPCFHGCSRNIGILLRSKTKILLHMPTIIKFLSKHKSFF